MVSHPLHVTDATLWDQATTWPFEEARKIFERWSKRTVSDRTPSSLARSDVVTFETGYGPSGLPHIGTFGEVVRTTMVRKAFHCLYPEIPTRLLCFSDDMDGLRKVPDNIPNPHIVQPFLEFPLTRVPDPFGQYESFGDHNNAMLRRFLDALGVDYTFMSATACYRSGIFDRALLQVLEHHRDILAIILPTLRDERRRTYSPFLPISPRSGRVLQVPMLEYRVQDGTVVFQDEDGTRAETPVTGGHCKLQWKVDWGMRWYALGVDYEMAGKDLIDSVTLATQVCRTLGGLPPQNLIYEHFLDQDGGKISKSKGNGLSVEEWLRYGPMESLSYFMYQTPRRAKRLHFDVIPKCVDDYMTHRTAHAQQDPVAQVNNPVWAVHYGDVPDQAMPGLSFALLLNLASACQGHDRAMLWKYVTRMDPSLTPQTHPFLDQLIGHAVTYYEDRVAPAKQYRAATDQERTALQDFAHRLDLLAQQATADANVALTPESIQAEAYAVGKAHFAELKDWFGAFYQVLLGQTSGPRVGSFVALYGIPETCALITAKLA